jgi:hypothetical protein
LIHFCILLDFLCELDNKSTVLITSFPFFFSVSKCRHGDWEGMCPCNFWIGNCVMIAWLKIPFFFHHSSPLHVLFLCILWVYIEVSAMSYWISYWFNCFDLVPGAVRQYKKMLSSCFLSNEHMKWCRGAAVMRFEYLTVMNIKIMVSVDVTLCIMRGLFLRNVLYVYSVLTLMFLINFGMYQPHRMVSHQRIPLS